MTKTQFLALCAAHVESHGPYVPRMVLDRWPGSFLRAEVSGGREGGNCWGGQAESFSRLIADPGLGEVLDSFLEQHVPQLSFLQYRKLQHLVQLDSVSESGYYGNWTEQAVWRLSFEDAWTVLEPMLAVAPSPAG